MWWNWEVDRKHYPDWENIIASQAERDVTVMSYINPFLVEIESSSNFEKSYFDEAKKRNLLLRDSEGSIVFVGQVGFRAALLDLSNPGARDFIKRIIKREIIDKGIRAGWLILAKPYHLTLSLIMVCLLKNITTGTSSNGLK